MNEEIQKNMLMSSTSLVGIVCKDGVVLGADRRVTAGSLIMGKNYKKILRVNDYLIAAYTGGVADAQLTNKILAAELKLRELRTKETSSVKEAAHLLSMVTYRNIRTPSMIMNIVGTLIAGVDKDGKFYLYTIEPAGGAYEVEDYDANFSSGMPYILGVLEGEYTKEINVEKGIELVRKCLKSSTQRDVGSGNGIDIFVVTKTGIEHVVAEEIVPQYR
ncbi:MAG: hypothetical protein AABX83_02275 [Nanoarchaeota archaeon]